MNKIDNESFDAKKTFETLLKTQNLKSLVQTNLEIQANIKSLDHDVQSLVFENYSKFISSIEVVKKMRQELEKTENDLEKLSASIENIKTVSSKIDDTLRPKREEIQKLDKINKDLSNLKMLCELPIMLKEDLKQLHNLDVRNLSEDELNKQKEDLLGIFRDSLENLVLCKDKLLEFCKEPLIAPIFCDVSRYLKEIQNYLFLHFHDNNCKLGFGLLADLYFKLFSVTNLVDVIEGVSRKSIPSSISVDNITLNFFKHIFNNFLGVLEKLKKPSSNSGQIEMKNLRNVNFKNSQEFSVFRLKIIEVFNNKKDDKLINEYQTLLQKIFLILNNLDKQINKNTLKKNANIFYQTKKTDFIQKILQNFYSEAINLNFYQKILIIISNKKYFPTILSNQNQNHPLKTLVETFIYNDILISLSDLRIYQDSKIIQKELIDYKNTKFPVIRDELNIKQVLSDAADDFTIIISHYAKFVMELIQQFLDNVKTSFEDLNGLIMRFLNKLISCYNNKTYCNEDFVKNKKCLEIIDKSLKREKNGKKGLKMLNYIFISRLVINFESNYDFGVILKVKHLLYSNVISFLQKNWLELFEKCTHFPTDLKIQTELLNSIKNLLFLVNNISIKGKPKTRISKISITQMHPKISETSKLLARQTPLFEKNKMKNISRQILYNVFTKLFFKNLKIFFLDLFMDPENLQGLFAFSVQASQILFEGAEKEDEPTVAALFYQMLDDYEDKKFMVNMERVNFFLESSKEQIF